MNSTLERWGKKVFNLEFNKGSYHVDYEAELLETDLEYIMSLPPSGKKIMVAKKDYINGIELLELNGFDLYHYFVSGIDEWRFNFESKKTPLNIQLSLYQHNEVNNVENCYIWIDGDYYSSLFDFLNMHPYYLKTITTIKEKFLDWAQNSNENRISYLLNPSSWIIIKQLDFLD